MLPFMLRVAVVVTPPFPSKVSVPTPTSGPAMDGGAVSNPLAVCTKVPFSVALEHPVLSAFAAGAMPRASAAIAAIAKVFPMVLRFMIISFVFSSCLAPFRFPGTISAGLAQVPARTAQRFLRDFEESGFAGELVVAGWPGDETHHGISKQQ